MSKGMWFYTDKHWGLPIRRLTHIHFALKHRHF